MASSSGSETGSQVETSLKYETVKLLLKMEKQFRDHYELQTQEISTQTKIIDSMQSIVEHLIEILSNKTRSTKKDELLHQCIEKRGLLLRSTNVILNSANNLQENVYALDALVTKLALGTGAHFVVDFKTNTALDYFAYTFENLFKYFNVVAKRMNIRVNQLDLEDEDALTLYRKLIMPSLDFETQLMAGLNLCKNIDLADHQQ